MKKLLVVTDGQIDFTSGVLGTKEAIAKIPNIVTKIKNWDGDIVCTLDTHSNNYLQTNEGKHLPIIHGLKGTVGWNLHPDIVAALNKKISSGTKVIYIEKDTFGSIDLANFVSNNDYEYVEIIGFCTSICVVANAILIKTFAPEIVVVLVASCCACVTPESHNAAIQTMKMCQIEIVGE